MHKNFVIRKVVAKECQELLQGGCQPSIEGLSARVFRLGQPAEIREAFNNWERRNIRLKRQA